MLALLAFTVIKKGGSEENIGERSRECFDNEGGWVIFSVIML